MSAPSDPDTVREYVRSRYAAAAAAATADSAGAPSRSSICSCCAAPVDVGRGESSNLSPSAESAVDACCAAVTAGHDGCDTPGDVEAGEGSGRSLYSAEELDGLPSAAALASLGCGNPTTVAELRPGETVLDLGSGGGIDVLLSARRVGPGGFAYGLDMTAEMLELARRNAAEAGVDNVGFLEGQMEDVPLDDGSIDVIISNCVVNLSVDKPAVMSEMARVLTPGGRIGISDIVAADGLSPQQRAERGSFVGCIAGALSMSEYRDSLASVGFTDIEVELTHAVADGMHSAIVRARKPS